ncbi:glycoside hydrolase family 16 protein [Halorubrum vacuolatum]|uniref:Glycosyl hydrolases family 16 n=1 Tax=Halorubrum vacuolatum TaxID=63740 RepID=A0A238Y805_HALVU|nr:family 16 glycosylhydrolase [Halorubrum vacuolatum]SNR67227.1 Glycosyl hydrolases family 16 [Halorubrum vacuolatum]
MDGDRRRRELLAGVTGLTVLGGAGCLDREGDGPPGEWRLVLEETWETFDTDRWAVGFIDREDWIPDDDATVSADHVAVEDGRCVLTIESDGTGPDGCKQGVINSSVGGEQWHPETGVPIDPEPATYVEARLKLPGRVGILPAFWMHPADMTWPPEIDIVELFQRDPSRAETERRTLSVDVHWSDSGKPGDRDTHRHDPTSIETEIDLTTTFNVYGCAWYRDRIEWYFNDRRVHTVHSSSAMLESLTHEDARPFGLILSNHVNRIGRADLTEPWTERLVCDWLRVWERT